MKICKYVPLHFVIRHHYSRLSGAFNFSYWWLLRCVTRSRYRPRAFVGIPDVRERNLPYIWGRDGVPCIPRHFNHCTFPLPSSFRFLSSFPVPHSTFFLLLFHIPLSLPFLLSCTFSVILLYCLTFTTSFLSNQIKSKTDLYSAIRRKRIRGAWWRWLDKLGNISYIKQFGL